ncbi:MAG: hypothetical protein F6K40_12350 [Okeania sp. SIO3I5]|uniref:hypothetical protein n=1 Tax=Okeania sp. SIO3I5 TaxID=2607805 RepID=UPI0013B8C06F|nr:hypothetical protein [Okeania sp. SIO3I5]NEQ37021.1 hypothetical protein [Okeania sp. SIO3I5]
MIEKKILADKCLGYYGASQEVNSELDYDGYPPVVSEETKEGIYQAIEKSYPQIKGMSEPDKKAVARWVINES